jgi:hypothetical protein
MGGCFNRRLCQSQQGYSALARLEMGGTSRLVHGLGYLIDTLGSQKLIADQFVLDLPAILGSLGLSLELLVSAIL